MNCFDHKDLGNHLLQLCPKVVKHPVYSIYYWRQWGCLTRKLLKSDCNMLFACTLGFLTFSLYTQKLFTCCYLRNTDASTFLFTCATWCVRYGLVTRIERTLHSNCLISLLHNHRVLLNYHMVHIPSAALCRSNTSWKDFECYVPKHTFIESSKHSLYRTDGNGHPIQCT